MPASSLPQLAVLVFVALATAALLWLMLRTPAWQALTDRPNERSLHARPTPRFGGIAMMAAALGTTAVLAAVADAASGPLPSMLAGALALAVLGALDDGRPVAIATRLLVHGLVAAGFVALHAGTLLERLGWQAPIAGMAVLVAVAVAIAWSINLYNFMDGSDGLAGSMALFGFSAYALAAPFGTPLGLIASALAGAAAGFLWFNWPPARLFMGDSGSIPLGFLAAAIGLMGWLAGYWPAWFGPLVFAPFVLDASVTLALRAARRQPVWRAHREHAYQKLNLLGLGHRGSLAVYLVLMAACALAALLGRGLAGDAALALLLAVAAPLCAGHLAVDLAWQRRRGRTPTP